MSAAAGASATVAAGFLAGTIGVLRDSGPRIIGFGLIGGVLIALGVLILRSARTRVAAGEQSGKSGLFAWPMIGCGVIIATFPITMALGAGLLVGGVMAVCQSASC